MKRSEFANLDIKIERYFDRVRRESIARMKQAMIKKSPDYVCIRSRVLTGDVNSNGDMIPLTSQIDLSELIGKSISVNHQQDGVVLDTHFDGENVEMLAGFRADSPIATEIQNGVLTNVDYVNGTISLIPASPVSMGVIIEESDVGE